jgi:outer membrane protein assembly factor BamE
MSKLLTFLAAAATISATGCSSLSDVGDAIPNALDRAPLIYRPTIQQGNVVTQEQVNELQPGMSKRQVRFLLGSPMLTDVFHANRWDYAFTLGEGSTPSEFRRVTVFFEDDRLVRITGDLKPQPVEERVEPEREIIVSVPDWDAPDKPLLQRMIDAITFNSDDD